MPATAGERAPGAVRDRGAMAGLCAAEGRAIARGEAPDVAGALEMTLLDDAGTRERAGAGSCGDREAPEPSRPRAASRREGPDALARRTPAPPPPTYGF